jgi:hypothetical protein
MGDCPMCAAPHLIAQRRADELRRVAERERLTRSIDNRRAPRRFARLRLAFIGRRSLVVSESI